MVLVDRWEVVKLVMRFDMLSNGWPFMYHCHNLLHEDNMMMLQYIVQDPSLSATEVKGPSNAQLFPVPAADVLRYRWNQAVSDVRLVDAMGRLLMHERVQGGATGEVNVHDLASGTYVLVLEGEGTSTRIPFVKQ